MKTLQPNTVDKQLAPIDVMSRYKVLIDSLQTEINNLNVKIAELNNTITNDTLVKNTITATDGIISETLESNTAEINEIDNNVLRGKEATFNTTTTDEFNTKHADITEASINNLSSTKAEFSDVDIDDLTFNTAKGTTAEINNIKGQTAEFTNLNTNKISTVNFEIPYLDAVNRVETAELKNTTANIENADIETANIEWVNADKTTTTINENDYRTTKQFILIEGVNPDDAPYPHYIELPYISDGDFRVTLRNNGVDKADEDTVFSLTLWTTDESPMINYTKTTDESLTDVWFDLDSKKLIIKTFGNGKLYWQSSDYNNIIPPVIYSDYTIPTNNYHFTTSRKAQIAVLGDYNTKVFTVQGILEGSIKDESEDKLWTYQGSIETLLSQLSSYLGEGDIVECAGYIYDIDDEKEYALEELGFDGENYYAIVDVTTGQDKIILTNDLNVKVGVITRSVKFDELING